jgi:AcrR family transcriptional regulator
MTPSKLPALKKDESRTKREEVLKRAEEEFAQHGFQGASLSAVARSAGLGNPGLLHHFPSKAKLCRDILEALAGELDEHLRAGISHSARRASGLASSSIIPKLAA